jgi:hypothetical protein
VTLLLSSNSLINRLTLDRLIVVLAIVPSIAFIIVEEMIQLLKLVVFNISIFLI